MTEKEERKIDSQDRFDNKGIFYGTSAAEGIPNPFCGCYLCEYARKHGGKDVRMRSMFRIGEKMMIDMGPDASVQALKYGDFRNLEYLLITHTHEDHFAYMMINVRNMASQKNVKTLNIYFTDKAYDIVDEMRNSSVFMKGNLKKIEDAGIVKFHHLDFGREYEINGCKVVPLKGHHKGNMLESCANYLIRLPDGKMLYYGTDTGAYEADTLDYLSKVKLDIWITECTYGNGEDSYPDPGHLSYTTCLKELKKLEEQGSINSGCKVYATHINHLHTAYHDKMQRMFDHTDFPYEFRVAYDGMEIDL